MTVVPQDFLDLHTDKDSYTDLHAAVINIVTTLRTISRDLLLLYIKKAILTLYNDVTEDAEIKQKIQADLELDDPLPSVTLSSLSTVLDSITKRLEPLSFDIVESKDMDDGSVLFTFVNKKALGSIQLSTKYSQNEIQLVKHAIDTIFSSRNVSQNETTDENGNLTNHVKYQVPYMKMVRSIRNGPSEDDEDVPQFNKLTLDEAELFLRDLECYGWLERYDGNYTLATRGLVELKNYLIDTYGLYPEGTISRCHGCADILTRGYACPNSDCGVHFHSQCKELFQRSKSDTGCPNASCDANITSFYQF